MSGARPARVRMGRDHTLEVAREPGLDVEVEPEAEPLIAPGRVMLTTGSLQHHRRRGARSVAEASTGHPARAHANDPAIQLELLCHELDDAIARGAEDSAVEAMLARAGVALRITDVAAITRQFRDGLPLAEFFLGAGGDAHHARLLAQRIVAHARSHERATPLDAATREAIERATGRRLPALDVKIDRSLRQRGRLGETDGALIRIAPEIAAPDDPLGRRVRLHEAAHVVQVGASDRPAGRQADVERDAHAIADAAARGNRREVGVRAAAGTAHGFGADDVAEALGVDPMSVLREQFPTMAALVDGGWDGLLQSAGDLASTRLGPLLDGTGLDQLGPTLAPILASFRADGLAFGVLTGCCECLDDALGQMLASFDGFLGSDGPAALQRFLAGQQGAQVGALLDYLTLTFENLREIWGPILTPIADVAIALGQAVWGWACEQLGLDASLPPLEAIERKLGELWASATAAIAPLRDAATRLWAAVSQAPIVATLIQFGTDIVKLADVIRTIQSEHAQEPALWLGIMARELRGTMFEQIVTKLQGGQDTATGVLASVEDWFRSVLDQLGLISAWNAAVPYLTGFASAAKGFFAAIESQIADLEAGFTNALASVRDALAKLYAAIKPLLDFVIGFTVAMNMGPAGIAMFAAGQTFRAIPPCYQLALTDFILDLFIKAVEFVPAEFPPTVLIKASLLGYLQTLRAADPDQKVAAMTMIARFASGDLEIIAGFVVGFFRGIGESTLGLLLLPLTTAPGLFLDTAAMLLETAITPFQVLYETTTWVVDLVGSAEPIARPGEEQEKEAPAEGVAPVEAPAPTEGEGDDGFDPLPEFPGFGVDLVAVFDKLFRGNGVTREDLDGFLASANVQLEELGTKIGGQVADKVLAALNADGTPYAVGEIVGVVAGWATGELIVALATMGLGTGLGATFNGGKLLAAIAKGFPKLVELLADLKAWLRPVIDLFAKLADEVAAAFERIVKWIDDLIRWAEAQIAKLVAWVRKKLGLKPLKPNGPDADGERELETDNKVVDRFEMDEEDHTLTVTREGEEVEVLMASTEGFLGTKLEAASQVVYELVRTTPRADEEAHELLERLQDELDELRAFFNMGAGPSDTLARWTTGLTKALVAIGRKYKVPDLVPEELRPALLALLSRQKMGLEGHEHDHIIYDALVELGKETREERDAANPDSPPPETAATIEKLKHKLGTTLTMYELACQRPGGDKDDPKGEVHRFTFQDHKLMVDTEQVSDDGSRANYVYPEQKILAVLDERAIMRKAVEEVHKAKATALKPLDREWDGVIAAKMKELKCGKKLPPEELAKLAPVKAEIDERRAAVAAPFDARVKALKDGVTDPARGYSYNDASWTKEQWAQVARDVATKPDAPDDIEKATMFVASMIVEASRFPISDVATLLILGDPNNPDAPIFDELPMTGGGTIKDPPDPTLPDAGGRATPSGEVTDAVVDLAKTTYQRSTGDSLPDEIGRRIDAGEDEPAIRTHIKGVLTANFFKG